MDECFEELEEMSQQIREPIRQIPQQNREFNMNEINQLVAEVGPQSYVEVKPSVEEQLSWLTQDYKKVFKKAFKGVWVAKDGIPYAEEQQQFKAVRDGQAPHLADSALDTWVSNILNQNEAEIEERVRAFEESKDGNQRQKFDKYSGGKIEFELFRQNGSIMLKITKNETSVTLERFVYSEEKERFSMCSIIKEISVEKGQDKICEKCYNLVKAGGPKHPCDSCQIRSCQRSDCWILPGNPVQLSKGANQE